MDTSIERNIRKYLRAKAQAQKINPEEPTMICKRNNLPIKFVSGYIYPRIVGCKCCYRTLKGRLIDCHMSWAKKTGWRNMKYHRSTMRVEVGEAWFLKHFQSLKGKK